MSTPSWLIENQHRLAGGGRWLLGNGPNWVKPKEWEKRKYRVLIARLSPFKDVLFSSTHRLLYAILRQQKQIFPDMAFLPPPRDTQALRQNEVPWWTAMGTHRGPLEFDCIAISNALVQELVNIAPLLQNAGIPLRKSERISKEEIPLLILGGANSLHSSLLWTKDPPIDGVFIGEEPASVQQIFEICSKAKSKGLSKKDILSQLCKEVPGFFEPDHLRPVEKSHETVPSINQHKVFEPMMPDPEVAGVAALHISEGCPSFCTFCAESYARKPYREVPHSHLLPEAEAMKRALGLEEVELFSFNFNNHQSIHHLIPDLLERFGRVGLKSQRFDALADDPALVDLMRTAGKSSLTCGLEGISDRMRTLLQKGLTTSQLQAALVAMLREPLRELKVFLIATGWEKEEDYEEFRGFLRWFKMLYDKTQRRPRITFSATPLVRFPWTPLEYSDGIDAETCGRSVRQIKDCVVRAGFDFREAASEWEAEVSQILIRAKDARIFDALVETHNITGSFYAELIDQDFALEFRNQLAKRGLPFQKCLAGHAPGDDVPWAQISPGIDRKFLVRMAEKSLQNEVHEICLGSVQKAGKCSACSACTPPELKSLTAKRTLLLPRKAPPTIPTEEVRLRVQLSPQARGWPYKTMSAWLLQAIMPALPELGTAFRKHGICEMERRLDDPLIRITGELDLVWNIHSTARPLLEALLHSPDAMAKIQERLDGWMEWRGIQAPFFENEWFVAERAGYFSPDAWLRAKGLKYTLTRKENRKCYEFSKDSLRKKFFHELWVEESSQGHQLHWRAQDKLSLPEFLRNCADFESSEDWKALWIQIFYKH